MKNKLTLVILFTALLAINPDHSSSVPLRFEISGTVSDYNRNYAEEGYNHPEISVGEKINGYLNWDTDIVPTYYSNYIYGALVTDSLNGTPFLQFSIGDIEFSINYSYYNVIAVNSDTYDRLYLHNLGGQSYYWENQRYLIDAPEFSFYGQPELYSGSYPSTINFADFSAAVFSIPTYNFEDLSDSLYHHFNSTMSINIDRIVAVPEPSVFTLLSFGVFGIVFFGILPKIKML